MRNMFLAAGNIEESEGHGADRGRATQHGSRISWNWLQGLPNYECMYRFRFYANELMDLVHALNIPDPFVTQSRHCFSAIEALCLLLARFRSAGDQNELVMLYQRSQAAISEVINELAVFIDKEWAHLLAFDHNPLLTPERLSTYAEAIYRAGAPLASIWGFIDCTIRAMCRPTWFQRQGYNGYKKYHALKYQGIRLPNGLFGHLYGPEPGRNNDNFLLQQSGYYDWAQEHGIRPGTDINTPPIHRYLQVFGDPAYGNNYHLISPFTGVDALTDEHKMWNEAMASVRIEVEHGFGDVVRLFPFLNAWWKHQLYSSPLGLYYRVGVILTNAHDCLRPNQTSQFFDCIPPTLEEYFQK